MKREKRGKMVSRGERGITVGEGDRVSKNWKRIKRILIHKGDRTEDEGKCTQR